MNENKEQISLDITTTINNIMDGMAHEEEFYRNILDKMVIEDRNHINGYLKLLPHKWSYAVEGAMKTINFNKAKESEVGNLPINSEENTNENKMGNFCSRHTYIGYENAAIYKEADKPCGNGLLIPPVSLV